MKMAIFPRLYFLSHNVATHIYICIQVYIKFLDTSAGCYIQMPSIGKEASLLFYRQESIKVKVQQSRGFWSSNTEGYPTSCITKLQRCLFCTVTTMEVAKKKKGLRCTQKTKT